LSEKNPSILELYQQLKVGIINNNIEHVNIVKYKIDKQYRNWPGVEKVINKIFENDCNEIRHLHYFGINPKMGDPYNSYSTCGK